MNDVLGILFFLIVFAMPGACLLAMAWMLIDEYRFHAWMRREMQKHEAQKLEMCDE